MDLSWFSALKDSKVVKQADDVLAATRYAVMMLRYARTETQWRKFNGPLVMPKIVFV